MSRRTATLKSRLLGAIILVVVLFPLLVMVYAMWTTRLVARRMIEDSLREDARHVVSVVDQVRERMQDVELFRVYNVTEIDRTPAEGGGYDERIRAEILRSVRPQVEAARRGGALLESIEIHTPDRKIFTEGSHVVTLPAGSPAELEQEILRLFQQSNGGRVRVRMDVNAGQEPIGLNFGLAFDPLRRQLEQFGREANRRAMLVSIVGTGLLAVLGGYIVFLNERTRNLQSELEKEQGLAYVGTLAAGLAHEIRNPLSSVKMNIQMIEQRLHALDKEQGQYLRAKVDRILKETTRLEDSISDFLIFAKPSPLQLAPTDVNALIRDVADFMEAECQAENIRLVSNAADGLPVVELDEKQLSDALRNLILNAKQAIGSDGTIELATRLDGRNVEIAVTDDGPGIEAQVLGKMFDTFYTTKENGTGLGLSTVRQIVEAHRGRIQVESEEGRGATFIVSLPVQT